MSRRANGPRTEFGRELLRRRVRARLSQQGLAKLSHLSPSLVNILERGEDYKTKRPLNPSVATIKRLAEGLSIDPFREGEEIVNERLRNEIYESLFRAMQYDLPKVSLEDVRQKLISITGDPELVEITMTGFEQVPHRDKQERDALVRSLRGLMRGLVGNGSDGDHHDTYVRVEASEDEGQDSVSVAP